jgi:glycerophosphoryl diester phosphodiesterase
MRVLILLIMVLSTAASAQEAKRISLQVQGHRGARARYPENTLPAFEHALSVGADVLEMDLAVTRDRKLVLSHDAFLNPELCLAPGGKRMESPIRIFSLSLDEVKKYDCGSLLNPRFPKQTLVKGTQIPTLEEVFAHVKKSKHPVAKKIEFNIETKIRADRPEDTTTPGEFAELLVTALKKNGLLRRATIQSFDFRTLKEARARDSSVRTVALIENRSIDLLKVAEELKPEAISPQWELLSAELVQKLHAAGVKVVPWTANEESAWKKLIEFRVDGIITDDPAELIRFLKRAQ